MKFFNKFIKYSLNNINVEIENGLKIIKIATFLYLLKNIKAITMNYNSKFYQPQLLIVYLIKSRQTKKTKYF